MTDLVALKQRVLDAEAHYKNVGLCNTWGKSAGELVEIDIAYLKAKLEYERAYEAYRAALSEATQ